MRFCEVHWTKLREALVAEGLGDQIAADGPAIVRRLADELETGKVTLRNFDPLMAAHWAIVGRIGKHAPGVLFIDGCPMCWAADEHERSCASPTCTVTRQTFEDWIPGLASFMREEWERLKAEAA